MPTLLRKAGYQFFMVMKDCEEPKHVHVKGGRSGVPAKFWLEPVELEVPGRYTEDDLRKIEKIIKENLGTLIKRWNQECARAKGTK